MALRKNISISTKVNAQDNGISGVAFASVTDSVYIKVATVHAAKDNAVATVTFTSGKITGERRYNFTVNLDGNNFIQQAYEHLKTLPEFAGAVDC
jgi:hypothetical protein